MRMTFQACLPATRSRPVTLIFDAGGRPVPIELDLASLRTLWASLLHLLPEHQLPSPGEEDRDVIPWIPVAVHSLGQEQRSLMAGVIPSDGTEHGSPLCLGLSAEDREHLVQMLMDVGFQIAVEDAEG